MIDYDMDRGVRFFGVGDVKSIDKWKG